MVSTMYTRGPGWGEGDMPLGLALVWPGGRLCILAWAERLERRQLGTHRGAPAGEADSSGNEDRGLWVLRRRQVGPGRVREVSARQRGLWRGARGAFSPFSMSTRMS